MAYSKVIFNGNTLMDSTTATATAPDITAPKTAMLADGVMTTGTGSGGGGSSWRLLKSVDVQYANSTSTQTTVANIVIGEGYDPDKVLWIAIRDTQGQQSGYYYGSDFVYIANAKTSGSQYAFGRCRSINGQSGFWQCSMSAFYGGLYPSSASFSGDIQMTITIVGKYSSTYVGTIDSTYRISVYALDYPTGIPSLVEL